MNLFDAANTNAPLVDQKYLAAKNSKPPAEAAVVEKFVAQVEQDGRVSMNMYPWVLRDVLASGRHQNIYEWAQERAGFSGRPVDEVLQEKLRGYYARRKGFDDSLDDGERFRYGCLNTGGAGAVKYGMFCVVLDAVFGEASKPVAYLKHDSLNEYTDSAGNVDWPKLESDASTHSSRHHLAGLKHMNQVPPIDEKDWPELLCSDSDYIEAIFVEDVTCDNFTEVRIEEKGYQYLKNLAFATFKGKRRRGTHALVSEFIAILRAEQDGMITIERL